MTDLECSRARLVLHLLPLDVARGAQIAARDLRTALDQPSEEHRILTFYKSDSVFLEADYSLELPMGRLRCLGYDPRVSRRLRAALLDLEPSVVIAHGGEPLKYVVPILPEGIRLIYFALGTATPAAQKGLRRLLYKRLFAHCFAIAAISEECTSELSDVFGVEPSRLFLLPNSRDPRLFYPSPMPRSPSRGANLLFVGHLTPSKRPDFFLDAVGALRGRGCNVSAFLVGDGPLEGPVSRRARAEGVQFLGRRLDVPAVLRTADIFLFTSEPESEGMPGVLIEAGLSGLPVVTTRTPGASTVVADGETGFIVGYDDFASFVDRVERLVRDPMLRASLGKAARSRCVERFANEKVHAAWRGLLASVQAP